MRKLKKKPRIAVGRTILETLNGGSLNKSDKEKMWVMVNEIILIAASIEYGDDLSLAPYARELFSSINKSYARFEAIRARWVDEKQMYGFTKDLSSIYKRANLSNLDEINEEIRDLQIKYWVTFKLSEDEISDLELLPRDLNYLKDSDEKGMKEFAVDQVVTMLGVSKSTFYRNQKFHRSQKLLAEKNPNKELRYDISYSMKPLKNILERKLTYCGHS